MPLWFPAIRAVFARRGIRLPQPYPHTARTLLGSALAALISGTVIGILYLLYSLACLTVDMTLQAAGYISRTTSEIVAEVSGDQDTSLKAGEETPENHTEDAVSAGRKPLGEESRTENLPRKAGILPDDAVPLEMRASLKYRELPYPEYRNLPFSEAVRQVDFALVQTILRLNIERGRIVLLTSEYREHNSESYQHQRIRIFLPPVAEDAAEGVRPSDQTSGTPPLPRRVAVDAVAEFVGTLEENLDAWASRGILSERPGKITLSVGSVVTHEIWLDVTDKRFSPAPAMALQHPPRLTIVMNDLGDDLSVTESLLALPIPVTFAVLPSSAFARETAEAAWQAGCEVLIHQPMQSTQWPYVKAGSDELTVDMSGETVATVLRNAQEKIPHASGLNNRMGSRLSGDRKATARIVRQIAAAGLYLLDDMARQDSLLYPEARGLGLPAWKQDIALDDGHPLELVVLATLKKAEQLAVRQGYAVVTGRPYPETLEALRRWANERDTAVEVVPLRSLPLADGPLQLSGTDSAADS